MKLESLSKVFSDGNHNAFTGLAFFAGQYFLAFRNATHHGSSPEKGSSYGRQMILTSPDAVHWTLAEETRFAAPPGLAPDTPMDARDNSFLVANGQLYLFSFVVSPLGPDGEFLSLPFSTMQTTKDGKTWSDPRIIFRGAVLWKPIFHKGAFWCAGYARIAKENRARNETRDKSEVHLFHSHDAETWTRGARIGPANEAVLLPREGDTLDALVRTGAGPGHLQIYSSRFPWENWEHKATIPKIIQGQHVLNVAGRNLLIAREVPTEPDGASPAPPALRRTKIWELRDGQAAECLELPSLGDNSYAGTVVRPDGKLLVSYYSQHEREKEVPELLRGGNDKPADIFVACINPEFD